MIISYDNVKTRKRRNHIQEVDNRPIWPALIDGHFTPELSWKSAITNCFLNRITHVCNCSRYLRGKTLFSIYHVIIIYCRGSAVSLAILQEPLLWEKKVTYVQI